MLAGFSEDTINGLKQSINMVSYKSLSEMDKILEKTSKNKDEPIKGNEDKGEDYNDR